MGPETNRVVLKGQRTSLTDVTAAPAAHSHRAFRTATAEGMQLVRNSTVGEDVSMCQVD